MKSFLITGVLALCLMASQVVQAAEDSEAKIKVEMVENYLLMQEAWKLRDADRMISFESPDYTSVDDEGTLLDKEAADAVWQDCMAMTQKVHSARVEIKKVTIEPKRVVVLSNLYLDADILEPDSIPKRLNSTVQSRDIWVLYDRIWMLKRSEMLSAKVLIDGKPQE